MMDNPSSISTSTDAFSRQLPPPHSNSDQVNDIDYASIPQIKQDVSTDKKPNQYFHHLALDYLSVRAEGSWVDLPSSPLLDLCRTDGSRPATWVSFDGTVYRGSVRRNHGYKLLLRDTWGNEIRAVPRYPRQAPLKFVFKSVWLLQWTIEETSTWIHDFASFIGFRIDRLPLSRVDVRCDVPNRFVFSDVKALRGHSQKSGGFKLQTHIVGSTLTGFEPENKKKAFRFTIYNKRLCEETDPDSHWPLVWTHFNIPVSSSIWRVEGRFMHERLRKHGVNVLADITLATIREMWTWFTTEYLIIVSNPSEKRTDRTKPKRKWKAVQAAKEMAPLVRLDRGPVPQRVDSVTAQPPGLYADLFGSPALSLKVIEEKRLGQHMTFQQTLTEINRRQLRLMLTSSGLRVGPTGNLTPALHVAVRKHQAKLIALCNVRARAKRQGIDADVFFSAWEHDPEAAFYAAWFWTYADTLPKSPFSLRQGETVSDPPSFYRSTARRIETLRRGGALVRLDEDLQRLYVLFGQGVEHLGQPVLIEAEPQSAVDSWHRPTDLVLAAPYSARKASS